MSWSMLFWSNSCATWSNFDCHPIILRKNKNTFRKARNLFIWAFQSGLCIWIIAFLGLTVVICVPLNLKNCMIIHCCCEFLTHPLNLREVCASIDICHRIYRIHFQNNCGMVLSYTSSLTSSCLWFLISCERKRTEITKRNTNLLNGQNPFSYQNLHF